MNEKCVENKFEIKLFIFEIIKKHLPYYVLCTINKCAFEENLCIINYN